MHAGRELLRGRAKVCIALGDLNKAEAKETLWVPADHPSPVSQDLYTFAPR